MIMSMTGYGRAEYENHGYIYQAELKSVNNRNFDCNIRIPRNYIYAEESIKALVKKHISRGKIDVFINISSAKNSVTQISVNDSLAKGYFQAIARLSEELNIPCGITALDVAKYPDVLTIAQDDADESLIQEDILKAVESALVNYDAMRCKEGLNLQTDISSRRHFIEEQVLKVETLSPASVLKYRERLYSKVKEVLEEKNIDENRVLQECAIFADKIAVDEETVRLKSHLSQLDEMLAKGSPIGKNIDFLVQEMNRETNTIGSKCNEIEITQIVILIKGEIEKIREQIQNIE